MIKALMIGAAAALAASAAALAEGGAAPQEPRLIQERELVLPEGPFLETARDRNAGRPCLGSPDARGGPRCGRLRRLADRLERVRL